MREERDASNTWRRDCCGGDDETRDFRILFMCDERLKFAPAMIFGDDTWQKMMARGIRVFEVEDDDLVGV